MLAVALARHEVGMVSDADQSDQRLVARCLANDSAALTELVERYQRDVYGVCLRLTHDTDAALELANTIFFKAYRNLGAYDASRPLRPWLLRIATNEALNYLRAQRRDQAHIAADATGELLALQVTEGDDLMTMVVKTETRERVRAAVARLSEPYRLLITLRFFNDLSYTEIAEQTGTPVSTIGVQLMRARAQLRRLLAGEEVADAPSS
jgi:RNA polymerase sigma-70 factor (ECF subfamily)